MLVLSRKIGQSICLPGSDTTITIAKATRNRVSLAIDAPREIAVSRGELSSPDDEDTVVEEDIATLWRPKPKSRAAQTAPTRACTPEPANILVAITNADERRRYADAFRSAGYRASEATDGLSCLSALRSDAFDMLVIDQHLIWGSGDGVIEVMHHDTSMEQVPVVLLNFPSPNESTGRDPNGQRELRCDEIVYIVQRRLAGSV
ncbi:carbon storage regulator [Rhodopirellula europaea]|uniref:carbon storage regulator n=1 Tax=Rhodopirellula europaea TaxID=1263866 RepID=UPI003D26BB66